MAAQNRSTLKKFFKTNAIPSEGNFGDLIDSQVNLADDGVIKKPGAPLGLVAPGNDKPVLELYSAAADPAATWSLSLSAVQDPKDPKTAKRGLSIGDAAGTSRLFIDQATGNVGVGTILPKHPLHVAGHTRIDGQAMVRSLSVVDEAGEPYKDNWIGLTDWIDDAKNKWLHIGGITGSDGLRRLTLYSNVVYFDGNVGIGMTSPKAGMHIDKGGTNDLALMLSSSGPGWGSGLQLKNTASGSPRTYGINAGSGRLQFEDVDANAIRMVINQDGNLGIGTTDPAGSRLRVSGDVRVDGNLVVQTHNIVNEIGALQQSVVLMPPVGAIIAFGGVVNPTWENATGWMLCDGRSLSQAQYPALFKSIGTFWGSSDANSFNVPDLLGRFLRGVDQGTGRDKDADGRQACKAEGNTGAKVGTVQDGSTAMPPGFSVGNESQKHKHQLPTYNDAAGGEEVGSGHYGKDWIPVEMSETNDVGHTHLISGWDKETRPLNAAVVYLIRWK